MLNGLKFSSMPLFPVIVSCFLCLFLFVIITPITIQDRVGSLRGGTEFLQLCGFEKIEGGEFLFLARDKVDMAVLHSAGSELDSAIKNPFFGVL